MIKLHAADRARIVVLKPVLEAGAVEAVLAGELASLSISLLELLKADVAVRIAFLVLRLWKTVDELFSASLALRLLSLATLSHHVHELLESRSNVLLLFFCVSSKHLVDDAGSLTSSLRSLASSEEAATEWALEEGISGHCRHSVHLHVHVEVHLLSLSFLSLSVIVDGGLSVATVGDSD